MGQQRTDTNQQLAAKQRVANSRKCHACGRRSAMSTRYELRDDFEQHIGSARTCNYCGAVRGIVNGEPFKEGSE